MFRWRHNANLGWATGPWTMALSNRYLSGDDDQPGENGVVRARVGHYSTWSLAGTYAGNRTVSMTAGVKNLLDEDPPFTAQRTSYQQGYDPRYTDPLGRTFYVRATYMF